MNRAFVWIASNDFGRELLDKEIKPLLRQYDLALEYPPGGADRTALYRAIQSCKFVICDCSVEDGHIYHKMLELVKASSNVLLVSRTALPINIYALHQCAPAHGEAKTNAELGAWLQAVIPRLLEAQLRPGYFARMEQTFREMRRRTEKETGIFISYRSGTRSIAEAVSRDIGDRLGQSTRIVRKGELAFERECMPSQQLWATVARLEQMINWAEGFALIKSNDYFDSFWTTMELFVAMAFRDKGQGIRGGLLVDAERWQPNSDFSPGYLDPNPVSRDHLNEYKRLVRQGDPGTTAPELRRGTEGLPGLLARIAYRLSGHAASPSDRSWWDDILVPCWACGPRHRTFRQVDWHRHLRLQDYGLFHVPSSLLIDKETQTVRCPACASTIRLARRHPSRVMWIPGPLFSKWPDDLKVLEERSVWEAVEA